jgi:hypothetical protein
MEDGSQARHAANLRWAADRNRLLPGERPQTVYSDDAEHWVRVYSDLLAFNLEMLDAIGKRMRPAAVAPDGPEQSDLPLLQAHVRRLRWRLSFWERRRAQLKPRRVTTEVQPPATTAIS